VGPSTEKMKIMTGLRDDRREGHCSLSLDPPIHSLMLAWLGLRVTARRCGDIQAISSQTAAPRHSGGSGGLLTKIDPSTPRL
jgi:hypothetical protein